MIIQIKKSWYYYKRKIHSSLIWKIQDSLHENAMFWSGFLLKKNFYKKYQIFNPIFFPTQNIHVLPQTPRAPIRTHVIPTSIRDLSRSFADLGDLPGWTCINYGVPKPVDWLIIRQMPEVRAYFVNSIYSLGNGVPPPPQAISQAERREDTAAGGSICVGR